MAEHMGEFDLIARYFKRPAVRAALGHTALGIGDDCALLQPGPGMQMAISSDMLVQGRHFFPDVDPLTLGHKALAVNLSDLAACGARPIAFTLALALPAVDETWLAAFSKGLFALADAHDCELIGGDTTQGPLNICITVFGEVPVVSGRSQALLRSGAQAGDDIYVSGTLGDARLALDVLYGKLLSVPPEVFGPARARLETPSPRVALGMALRGIASAAIDVSDGLLGDLGHILAASKAGAVIDTSIAINLIASHAYLTKAKGQFNAQKDLKTGLPACLPYVLAGGDDYELLFTAPPAHRDAVLAAAHTSCTPVTRVGQIQSAPGLRLIDEHGAEVANTFRSFDHFSRP